MGETGRRMPVEHIDYYESPLGILWLTGAEGILTGLSFSHPGGDYAPGSFDAAKHWLDDYFQGAPREIEFPLSPKGTAFQLLIWKLLLEIPYGKTATYGELSRRAASELGREKMSAQAVGQAAHRNPIAIIIPCHRLVGAGGNLTGYASGLDRKRWLLNHEQEEL